MVKIMCAGSVATILPMLKFADGHGWRTDQRPTVFRLADGRPTFATEQVGRIK